MEEIIVINPNEKIEELKNKLREIEWEEPEKKVAELREKMEWQTTVFEHYESRPLLDWKDHIYHWLTQFEDIKECLTAMKILNNIIFVDETRYRELQRFTYWELENYVRYVMNMEVKDFLSQVLFFPVDGSGEVHLTDFMRVNKIGGRKDRIGGRLYLDEPDILLDPIKSKEKLENLEKEISEWILKVNYKEFLNSILYSYKLNINKKIEELKKKYKTRKYLCIITDFIGTGDTIIRDIERIMKSYEIFEKIFVIAYIGTECGLEKIRKIDPEKIETVICGLELPNGLKVFSKDNLCFTDEEKDIINRICDKYFSRFSHPDIEKFSDEIKYGYRGDKHSCGNSLLVCLYTNCPNNSLPILWAGRFEFYDDPDKWTPLFERIPSYLYHIIGGGKI